MSIPMSVLPEPVAATPQVRAVAPSISSAGINDNSALARQQLPTAVSAPSVIAAYAPNIAAPPKPPMRPSVAVASTPFAAQFLSQTSEVSDEDLALFAPRSMPTTITKNDDAEDFSSPIRIARGEITAAKGENARAEAPPQEKQAAAAQQQAQASIARQVTGQSPAPASALGAPAVTGSPITINRSQLASTGSASMASPAAIAAGKRQAFALARAVGAYEYTDRRNAAIDRAEGISAVL